ncbi:hypothetical protein DPMN_025557 [Dreissena polymorpha]|uniref:STAS domain-containing protein n=1 Tax=Dreissena polymorpha TaxID=45954 RepID=A0A9D4RCN2_DREPO|nr:hypothetical protein DPMN_025557 [Dreissena polymorpha]
MLALDMDSSQTSRAHVKVIIIDCSCMGYIDTQGINALLVVGEEYRRAGVAILFSGCTPCVWAALNRSDFFSTVSKERVFSS